MEALYPQIWEKDGVLAVEEMEEDVFGKEEEEREECETLSSAMGSEEESDDDLERPPIRRRVSFADAFGYDLVSVKEFDAIEPSAEEVVQPAKVEVQLSTDEFYISCLFMVPSDPEELEQRVQEQMAELEHIELLPGTSILRGIIRVVNLCFGKSVYVRTTLDGWRSHFDLLAEYVPGSSDRITDRFAFQYILVPPFDREGTRVEFCIRYETEVGVFWVNNQDFNYVLLCHQKSHVKEGREKEQEPVCKEESHNQRGKRSCLRCSSRKDSAEEHANESSAITTDVSEPEAVHKAEDTGRKTVDNKEIDSILEHDALMDSARSRRRVARLQDHLDQEKPGTCLVDSARGLPDTLSRKSYDHHQHHYHHRQPGSNSSYGLFRIRHKKPADESPQILTYHQIPLLPLDWSDDNRTQCRGVADENDIWTRGKKRTLSKSAEGNADYKPTVSDLWEAFLKGNNENIDDNLSVCDVWQDFLNGPDRKDHSSVPESEWLQSAASVSPSHHRESLQTPPATQRVSDTPAHGHAHSLPECRLVSGPHETSAANTKGSEPTGAGQTASLRDDGTSRNSEGSPVTDTPCKFSPTGPTPVSGGSTDSLCCQHVVGRGRGGETVKDGGEEGALTLHTAVSVTSSGEKGTTEMTAIAESQNASAVDRISQGARPDEGLSSSGEGEVAGNAHNVACDTVAFRETIRLGTKDERRSVLFTSRQAGDEGQALSYTETKAHAEKGIFRPQESGEAATSQGCADVKKCEEFRPEQNSENALTRNEEGNIGHLRSDEFGITEGESRQGPPDVVESKSNEAEWENRVSDHSDSDKLREAKQEEVSCHTADDKAAGQSSVEVEFNQAMYEEVMNDGEQGWSQTLVDTDLRRREDDVGGNSRPQECTLKGTVAEKDISCELRQTLETSEGMGGDMSQRDTGAEVSIGKLKIEALGEWMCDAENTPDQWKKLPKALTEQEVSAERVECPRQVQCEKLSEGTKDPIICDDITVLKMGVELGVEEEFTDIIDQGMDEGLVEEVLDWKDTPTAFERTGLIAEEMGGLLTDTPDVNHSKQLNRAEDGLSEQFDSGVFSLVELATDLNPSTSLNEDLNLSSASCSDCDTAQCSQLLTETVQTLTLNENINYGFATCSNECSTFESGWSLVETAHSSIISTPELISNVKPAEKGAAESDIGVTLDQSPPLSADQESANQIKYRPLSHQEIGGQSEGCLVTHQESNNRSSPPSEESLPSSSELDNASRNVRAGRNVLFSISQVLLIAALVVTTLLYGFPSCFVFYVVSLCWWVCQVWKHRVSNATKG